MIVIFCHKIPQRSLTAVTISANSLSVYYTVIHIFRNDFLRVYVTRTFAGRSRVLGHSLCVTKRLLNSFDLCSQAIIHRGFNLKQTPNFVSERILL